MSDEIVKPGAIVRTELEARVEDTQSVALVASYFGSLQSERSRTTARESLRRAARAAMGVLTEKTRIEPESIPWTRLGLDELNALRQRLAEFYPPSTANMTLGAVRGLYRIAYLKGWIDERQREAALAVKNVRGSRLRRGGQVSPADYARFIATLDELPSVHGGTMMRAALAVCVGGGLRRDEVCRITVSAYDATTRVLRVLGKGNKERKVVVDDDMREPLEAWLSLRSTLNPPHDAMFCAPVNYLLPLRPKTFWKVLRRTADACGIEFTGPHDLRRTFASRALDEFDLLEVQKMMGHANPSTTALYDHRDETTLEAKRRRTKIIR
jgi:integrase